MYKHLTLAALIALFFTGQVSADSHIDPDLNDDGVVDASDLRLLIANWGTRADEYDLQSDGVIDASDLRILIANWGKTFPVPQSEREALVALYNAMGGSNWTNNTNWLSDNDISTWHGVNVSNEKVTGLNLAGNNLTGMIPAELGNLTNLEELNFSLNQLRGAIPAALGNLTKLRKLWLVGNPLRGGQLSGALPEELGNLTNLEVLILNHNQLSGALPQSLTGLTNLTHFSFGNNMGLCAPSGIGTWLRGIADTDGPDCQ